MFGYVWGGAMPRWASQLLLSSHKKKSFLQNIYTINAIFIYRSNSVKLSNSFQKSPLNLFLKYLI